MNHQYLWKVLVRYGYSSVFVNIIKFFYQQTVSRIMINEFLTEKIMISRSVQQNCPMLVLFIEPMIRAINHNTSAQNNNARLGLKSVRGGLQQAEASNHDDDL
jgi:hypothetical protein